LDTLLQLGLCARDIKEYDNSIKILKKALQYAWYLNIREKESDINEHIAIAYYYLGDMENCIRKRNIL
jgi:tetratricopeptide (TPR) repeat protein